MIFVVKGLSPYKLVYKAFRLGGLMNQDGRPWSLIYTIFILITLNLLGITAVIQLIWGKGNLKETVLAFSAVIIYKQTTVKAVVILVNESKVRHFLKRLEKYRLEVIEDNEESELVYKADSFGAKFILFFGAAFYCFPFGSFFFNLIIDYASNFKTLHLVLQLWIPWRMNEFWPYVAGHIFIASLTLFGLFVYVSFCVMEFTFTLQMSAYLKLLQNRMETKGCKDRTIYYHHKTIIQFIREYNELFSGAIYQEVLVSPLHPCGFAYALIKAIKRYESGTLDLMYKLLMTLFAPIMLCTCGQEIKTQMEKLHECSYMSNWYEEKPKFRRDLYTMMLMTNKPIAINYKSFIEINYICLSKILQGIYSYLTMIINVEER